jgi:hypothetical protein
MTECTKFKDFPRVLKNKSRISDCREYFPFIDEQLTHSVQDFFDAGIETTSSTLKWALLYLIHHQDCQKTLQDDIDDFIGQGQPQIITKGRSIHFGSSTLGKPGSNKCSAYK